MCLTAVTSGNLKHFVIISSFTAHARTRRHESITDRRLDYIGEESITDRRLDYIGEERRCSCGRICANLQVLSAGFLMLGKYGHVKSSERGGKIAVKGQ